MRVLYGAEGEDAFRSEALLPGPIVTGRPFAADLDTDGATDLLIPSLSGLIELSSEGGVLTGSLVLERIFALPGMGSHFIEAALQRDYTLCMGMVLVYTVLTVVLTRAITRGLYRRYL